MMHLQRFDPDEKSNYPGEMLPMGCAGGWCQVSQAAELLRPIRLHHWRQVLRYSELLPEAEAAGAKDVAKRVCEWRDLHLGFVQQLNEFFEPGDTAEKDAENGR